MSFRTDTPIQKTRKLAICRWCHDPILVGSSAVTVRGGEGSDIWSGRFHNECWRAETAYWDQPHVEPDEGWPDERMPRGVTTDWTHDSKLIYWKDDPVTLEEARSPRDFRELMSCSFPPLHPDRLTHPLEKAFRETWEAMPREFDILNGPIQNFPPPEVAWDHCKVTGGYHPYPYGRMTPRDRMVTTEMAQWLGTNLGMSFLRRVFDKVGGSITYTDYGPDKP